MNTYIQSGATIVLIALMLFLGCICSTAKAEEGTLDQSLAEIKQRANVERDTAELEPECLNLLKKYDLPEDKGKIYSQIASIYARSDVKKPQKIIEYCKKSLRYPLEIPVAVQAYIFWGEALETKYHHCAGGKFPKARREIIVPYLTGLKLILDNQTAAERPSLPSVDLFDAPPDSPLYEQLLKKHAEQMASRKEAMLQDKLITYRWVVTGKIVFLYSQEPHATNELRQLASKVLKNSDAVKELLARVEAKDQQKKFPPPR